MWISKGELKKNAEATVKFVEAIAQWQNVIAQQLKSLAADQDKLLQSHAGLEAEQSKLRMGQAAAEDAFASVLGQHFSGLDERLFAHEQQQQKEFAALAGYVGANQAVLDTLVGRMDTGAEAWDKGYDAGIEATVCAKCDKDAKRKASRNGKRKKKAA